MSKITENHAIMLKLIQRSPDIGDGWRNVSEALWRHVEEQAHPDLTELDPENRRVRLTEKGVTVVKYAL